MKYLPLLVLLLASCDAGVTSTSGRAACNGELDLREETVDDQFDADGDGFVDGGNPECQENYAAEELDCNDTNADVFPGADEVSCNDIDDDCTEDTPDDVDADDDGYSLCEGDCADGNPDIAPGFPEEQCDDLDNDCNPATLDSQDVDMDGWSNCEDCVDTNEDINPDQTEEICDGADNDCDPLTIDGTDADGDGSSDCFDCDDNDPNRYPGNVEVCEDSIDQNCDGVDDDCPDPTWQGNWTTNPVNYTCGGGNVVINFSTISIQDNTPNLTFVFVGGIHPGAMTGTIDGSNNFVASGTSGGSCSQSYNLTGSFLGQNSFSAQLSATFSGCAGCTNQTWTLSGTR